MQMYSTALAVSMAVAAETPGDGGGTLVLCNCCLSLLLHTPRLHCLIRLVFLLPSCLPACVVLCGVASALVPEVTSVLESAGCVDVTSHQVTLDYKHLTAEAVLRVRHTSRQTQAGTHRAAKLCLRHKQTKLLLSYLGVLWLYSQSQDKQGITIGIETILPSLALTAGVR